MVKRIIDTWYILKSLDDRTNYFESIEIDIILR